MADVQHFSGTVTPVASTTSKCGLVVTPGAEPTTPEPGGIWYDTGDDCLVYFAPDGTKTYLPKGTGLAGQVLTSNGLDTVPTYQAHTPTPPGGADKQLQYNNATAFGGISNGNVGEVLISAGAGAIPAFGPHGLLLHGVVPPVDLTDGANGDFFLDTATSTLYGPKAGGAWPGGVSIIGAPGAAGAAGTGYLACETKRNQAIAPGGAVTSDLVTFTALTAALLNTLNRHLTIEVNGYFITAGGETPTLNFFLSPLRIAAGGMVTGNLTAGVKGSFRYRVDVATAIVGANGQTTYTTKLDIELTGPGTVTQYIGVSDILSDVTNLTEAITPIVKIATSGACTQICGVDCKLIVS